MHFKPMCVYAIRKCFSKILKYYLCVFTFALAVFIFLIIYENIGYCVCIIEHIQINNII